MWRDMRKWKERWSRGQMDVFYCVEGWTLNPICFHSPCHIMSLSLFHCENVQQSTSLHLQTPLIVCVVLWISSFFSHPNRLFLHSFLPSLHLHHSLYTLLCTDMVFFHQVWMFPPHFPNALHRWPLSHHKSLSGWNIELVELPQGIWQPHTLSPVLMKDNM